MKKKISYLKTGKPIKSGRKPAKCNENSRSLVKFDVNCLFDMAKDGNDLAMI